MQESANLALSFVRAPGQRLGLKSFLDTVDLHVPCPKSAIRKTVPARAFPGHRADLGAHGHPGAIGYRHDRRAHPAQPRLPIGGLKGTAGRPPSGRKAVLIPQKTPGTWKKFRRGPQQQASIWSATWMKYPLALRMPIPLEIAPAQTQAEESDPEPRVSKPSAHCHHQPSEACAEVELIGWIMKITVLQRCAFYAMTMGLALPVCWWPPTSPEPNPPSTKVSVKAPTGIIKAINGLVQRISAREDLSLRCIHGSPKV